MKKKRWIFSGICHCRRAANILILCDFEYKYIRHITAKCETGMYWIVNFQPENIRQGIYGLVTIVLERAWAALKCDQLPVVLSYQMDTKTPVTCQKQLK